MQEFSAVHTVCRPEQGYSQRALPAVKSNQLPTIQPTRAETTIPRATPPSNHRHSKDPNRRSTSSTSLPSSNPALEPGHISRYGYCNTGGPPSSVIQTTAFSTELASYIRRTLDLEHSEGVQFRAI